MKFGRAQALTALCLLGRNVFTASAIDLDPTQPSQVRDASKKIATGLMSLYANEGGVLSGIPGLLTYPPYYWWEAGAMFGTMIDYWYFTGDTQFNERVKEGIQFQKGEHWNLMPSNQSKDEGNDDQLFWAFTVMSAAELGFPDPGPDQPGWLALAQSVINQLNSRWEEAKDICGGGLRWQIYQWLPGFDYKNTPANGGMFQLAARLAMYTGNKTYAEWAERSFNWLMDGPLITDDFQVYDGIDTTKGCVGTDQNQWTYNYGMLIAGAAVMYNYTDGSEVWKERVQGFLNRTDRFFPDENGKVMTERCEKRQICSMDQWSFKAYLSRWLATAAQLAPFTYPQIKPLLEHSAIAAAKTCTGGETQNMCGSRWYFDSFDGNGGVGQQMSALSIISANLIPEAKPPVTAKTGGTSKGNPAAGTGNDNPQTKVVFDPVTTGDRAGAGILTAVVLVFIGGGGWWLIH